MKDVCTSCGKPFGEHLGIIGTCKKLKEAEKRVSVLAQAILNIREEVAAGNNGLAPSYILNSHDFHTTISAVVAIIDKEIAKAKALQ